MSKSFWIQVLSAAVIVINSLSGSMIPTEFLALALAACNLILFILKDNKIDKAKALHADCAEKLNKLIKSGYRIPPDRTDRF